MEQTHWWRWCVASLHDTKQIPTLAERIKRFLLMAWADPKKWTQKAVGALLGVARNTVSDWFITNVGADNTNKTPTPDARVKP